MQDMKRLLIVAPWGSDIENQLISVGLPTKEVINCAKEEWFEPISKEILATKKDIVVLVMEIDIFQSLTTSNIYKNKLLEFVRDNFFVAVYDPPNNTTKLMKNLSSSFVSTGKILTEDTAEYLLACLN